MGWYGNYNNIEEVIGETERGIERLDYQTLDIKKTKTYAIILYRNDLNEIQIDSFIYNHKPFGKGVYKPIWFLNDENYFNRIPKKWLKLFNTEENIKIIEEQKEILRQKREQKRKEPKLDDILEVGRKYKIWGEHEVEYAFKKKRTHIFKNSSGGYIKFTRLKAKDVEAI